MWALITGSWVGCADVPGWQIHLYHAAVHVLHLVAAIWESPVQRMVHLLDHNRLHLLILQLQLGEYLRCTAETHLTSQDFVVDWSLLRPQSAGLRPDLGYSRRYLYYFAMVTNFLTRFYWVWYVPYPSRNRHLRSFILAMAEMLRRWQWNFCKSERRKASPVQS